MKRNRSPFAGVLGLVAALGLAGCGALPDDSYRAVEDGAREALSATFSFSAGVANWLAEPAAGPAAEPAKPPQAPPCTASLKRLSPDPFLTAVRGRASRTADSRRST